MTLGELLETIDELREMGERWNVLVNNEPPQFKEAKESQEHREWRWEKAELAAAIERLRSIEWPVKKGTG